MEQSGLLLSVKIWTVTDTLYAKILAQDEELRDRDEDHPLYSPEIGENEWAIYAANSPELYTDGDADEDGDDEKVFFIRGGDSDMDDEVCEAEFSNAAVARREKALLIRSITTMCDENDWHSQKKTGKGKNRKRTYTTIDVFKEYLPSAREDIRARDLFAPEE